MSLALLAYQLPAFSRGAGTGVGEKSGALLNFVRYYRWMNAASLDDHSEQRIGGATPLCASINAVTHQRSCRTGMSFG